MPPGGDAVGLIDDESAKHTPVMQALCKCVCVRQGASEGAAPGQSSGQSSGRSSPFHLAD